MLYKILLVDDDEDFLDELKDYLNNYSIVCTTSGREAVTIFKKPHLIDLVILDMKLPDMQGIEVLKEMKKKSPDLDIIVLTGQGTKEMAIEALKGAVSDFLEKPINPVELNESIQRVLKSNKNKNKKNVQPSHPRDIAGKIELAKRFAQNNYDKRINLKDVAEELFLSPKYFSRVFKEHTGQGFNEYRLKIKIKEAKKLLLDMDLSVNEIAKRLGYEELKSLTRLFRKYSGQTPSCFREKLQVNSKK